MPATSIWPGLTHLDRGFAADYAGDQLDHLFPGAVSDELIRDGVLAAAGIATRMRGCVCELRRSECTFRVDCDRGRYWAKCEEYGLPIELSRAQVQRYRFNWRAWADGMRRKNALGGADPVMGVGVVHVGSAAVGGQEFALVVVAPGCQRATDVVVPEAARRGSRLVVALHLGEPTESLPVDALLPLSALGADLRTIDQPAITRAIVDARRESSAGAAGNDVRTWSGRALTAKEAAPTLDYSSGDALLKAVRAERIQPGDPLHILRQRGPGRTPGGKFREDAVQHVAGLLAKARKEYDVGVARRREAARAIKAATSRPDPEAAERRIKQALARKEKGSR